MTDCNLYFQISIDISNMSQCVQNVANSRQVGSTAYSDVVLETKVLVSRRLEDKK